MAQCSTFIFSSFAVLCSYVIHSSHPIGRSISSGCCVAWPIDSAFLTTANHGIIHLNHLATLFLHTCSTLFSRILSSGSSRHALGSVSIPYRNFGATFLENFIGAAHHILHKALQLRSKGQSLCEEAIDFLFNDTPLCNRAVGPVHLRQCFILIGR